MHRRTSKFLSYVLRHHPEAIGLELDNAGWTDVDDLIAKANAQGRRLDRDLIVAVVVGNDKQRFKLSQDGQRIRASQGHSRQVDLGLEPITPPELLYHGTAERFLDSILADGLVPRDRQHVHLSADVPTAIAVGQRHGRPVVLRVAAGAMANDGHTFYRSDNGVWLTDRVPAERLTRQTSNPSSKPGERIRERS
ncbi:MAG: RNA 2'-phosphotransferase [Pseudomonadota bacterium]